MTRCFACLTCAALLAPAAFGQATGAAPAFEAADIHESGHSTSPFQGLKGPFFRRGIYSVRSATMLDLIVAAYGVSADKVLGGPRWLELDRFDAIAKVPPQSTVVTRKEMLRALLAERFGLVVHNDTRGLPAYGLTAGKRPSLKKSDGSGASRCDFSRAEPQPGGPPPMISYACHNITMAAFAEGMGDMAGAFRFLNNLPVVDQTKLEGAWDFDLKYSGPGRAAQAAADRITLPEALEKQLGLKIEAAQIPVPVIVVDKVNRKPTENVAGVKDILKFAPVPTEFEVAEIKPTEPEFQGLDFDFQPGGRVSLRGVTLKLLIQQIWDVTDEMLVGAPKWMDTDRFDVIAKASAVVAPPAASPTEQPDIDFDAVMGMVKTLVAERFKLVTHTEARPVSAYTLTAVKPKLKKADPASRTMFKEGPATFDAKDPRNSNPALSRLVTVQNMTMAQFAEKLQAMASGYIHAPVLDATGLEGSWDFTLSFSPVGMFRGGRGGDGGRGGEVAVQTAAAGAVPEASDPGSGLTLFEAMEKQLGLKLVLQKRPLPVLVIDHVEEKPEN